LGRLYIDLEYLLSSNVIEFQLSFPNLAYIILPYSFCSSFSLFSSFLLRHLPRHLLICLQQGCSNVLQPKYQVKQISISNVTYLYHERLHHRHRRLHHLLGISNELSAPFHTSQIAPTKS